MRKRLISILFLLAFAAFSLLAVKAYPYPVVVSQPDGTKITLLVRGDEFFNYKTTLNGRPIAQDTKGFYRERLLPSNIQFIRNKNIERYELEYSIPKTQTKSSSKSINYDGSFKALVIPVFFQDVAFSKEEIVSHLDNMLNLENYSENGATGSVVDYYKSNIGSSFDLSFTIASPIQLSEEVAYYGANMDGTSDINVREMVKEACLLADSDIDFSLFDNDNDGYVDNVFIFYAGYNEAEGGDDNTIWPHSWSIRSFNLSLDGVKIDTYACTSELKGASGNELSGIGTFCHEFGHVLGLVDLYDTDNELNGKSEALWGMLSLMDEGNYNNQGRTPPYLTSIEREILGIIEKDTIQSIGTYELKPINEGSCAVITTSTQNEYYLLETRRSSGWDAFIQGEGMLIYHIDKSQNLAGNIRAVSRWKSNIINAFADHQCTDLIEAYSKASNISQIFFPGSQNVTNISILSNPPLIDWSGLGTGYLIKDISNSGNNISFVVEEDDTKRFPKILNLSSSTLQTSAEVNWETDVEIQSKWGLRWAASTEEVYHDVVLTKMNYTIKGLLPQMKYKCELFPIGKISNGDTLAFTLTTMGITSSYPAIFGLSSLYKKGDIIDLTLFNIAEEYSMIEWFVNDILVSTDKYTLKETGEVIIKAKITYKEDDSQEFLLKKIVVAE